MCIYKAVFITMDGMVNLSAMTRKPIFSRMWIQRSGSGFSLMTAKTRELIPKILFPSPSERLVFQTAQRVRQRVVVASGCSHWHPVGVTVRTFQEKCRSGAPRIVMSNALDGSGVTSPLYFCPASRHPFDLSADAVPHAQILYGSRQNGIVRRSTW